MINAPIIAVTTFPSAKFCKNSIVQKYLSWRNRNINNSIHASLATQLPYFHSALRLQLHTAHGFPRASPQLRGASSPNRNNPTHAVNFSSISKKYVLQLRSGKWPIKIEKSIDGPKVASLQSMEKRGNGVVGRGKPCSVTGVLPKRKVNSMQKPCDSEQSQHLVKMSFRPRAVTNLNDPEESSQSIFKVVVPTSAESISPHQWMIWAPVIF